METRTTVIPQSGLCGIKIITAIRKRISKLLRCQFLNGLKNSGYLTVEIIFRGRSTISRGIHSLGNLLTALNIVSFGARKTQSRGLPVGCNCNVSAIQLSHIRISRVIRCNTGSFRQISRNEATKA